MNWKKYWEKKKKESIKTNNQIFTEYVSEDICKICNLPSEVVSCVIRMIMLSILDDASKQAEETDIVMLRIPQICDIEVRKITSSNRIKINNVYFEDSFRSKLKESLFTDDPDHLSNAIIDNLEQLITDKFINAVKEIEKEDKYG